MARSKNFVFTWNNYPPDAELLLKALHNVKYICGGYEVGASGTPHIQGYVVFNLQKTHAAVVKMMPGCHVELAKTVEEGISYCKKDGVFFEYGVPPKTKKEKGDGEKERWANAVKLAKAGDIESIDADIQLRFYRTLKEMKKDYMVAPPLP